MEGLIIKKGQWTSEEDNKLIRCIMAYGAGNWGKVPQRAGLNRNGKSCRQRWINYLRPGIKRGNLPAEEELQIIHLHSIHGNRYQQKNLGHSRWSKIASLLKGRTYNEIRNFCNKHTRKGQLHQGDGINHPTSNSVAQHTTSGLCSEQQYCTGTNFTGNGGPQTPASSFFASDDEKLDDWINELLADTEGSDIFFTT